MKNTKKKEPVNLKTSAVRYPPGSGAALSWDATSLPHTTVNLSIIDNYSCFCVCLAHASVMPVPDIFVFVFFLSNFICVWRLINTFYFFVYRSSSFLEFCWKCAALQLAYLRLRLSCDVAVVTFWLAMRWRSNFQAWHAPLHIVVLAFSAIFPFTVTLCLTNHIVRDFHRPLMLNEQPSSVIAMLLQQSRPRFEPCACASDSERRQPFRTECSTRR